MPLYSRCMGVPSLHTNESARELRRGHSGRQRPSSISGDDEQRGSSEGYVQFLVFSGIMIGYIILLPPEMVFV